MIKIPILLLGAGGHARACIDTIEQEGHFIVAGLVGQASEIGTEMFGYRVIGTDAELPDLLGKFSHALVAVGQIKTPELRMRLFDLVEQIGSVLPVIVSPRAYVSHHATIGAGTIVLPGAVINAGAVVGRNCIINSQALVEHDALIFDHCHVATGAVINSGVRVGAGSFIGSNTCVRQGINIGERCLIGMGQRVHIDCEAGCHMPPQRKLP